MKKDFYELTLLQNWLQLFVA